MFLNYGLILNTVLLVGGVWWCKEIWGRRHSDIIEFKESDDSVKKGVIAFFWLTTVPIAGVIAFCLWRVISNLIDVLG